MVQADKCNFIYLYKNSIQFTYHIQIDPECASDWEKSFEWISRRANLAC